MIKQYLFLSIFLLSFVGVSQSDNPKAFSYLDVFQLEYASNPQISPNGQYVVYRRMGFNIQTDRSQGALWIIDTENPSFHQKLTNNITSEYQAMWSPNGDRIAYVSRTEHGSEIFIYWLNSGKSTAITQLNGSPSNLSWSPDGLQIAFTMKVAAAPPVLIKMPKKPKGAKWAKPARITDRLRHEADGAGYISPGFTHIFTVPANGGTPRQLTTGNYNHQGQLSWLPNGKDIVFSSNRNSDWEYDFRNSHLYKVSVTNGEIKQLTTYKGPAYSPAVSPDGKWIAYLGFEDKIQAYQTRKINLISTDGQQKQVLSKQLDRSISSFTWDSKSKGVYIQYNDLGLTKLAHLTTDGSLKVITDNVGGTTLGRPYASGSFSVAKQGKIAYTISNPHAPADIAIVSLKQPNPITITQLNTDLLDYKTLGKVEEIWYKSSVDGLSIQGWVVYPPDFDATKKYPLLVENHGGPILNYGPHFSAEMQLYAAAGYMVFYPNPRGSTSYGEAFGNLLYNNYPGEDYNDVIDGVDAVIAKGHTNTSQLYVTGGSAGGIMTAWIVGKTNRFRAAVVAKPVVNWISKTLVADNYFGYADYRYPKQPWENFEGYWKFSPISLVGQITTPTMVMVGMNDLRTPPSEAKQLYHALKLQKKETVLVEIPEASHGIASRPSNLISKIAHTIAWFKKYE